MTRIKYAKQIGLQSLLKIFRRHRFNRFADNADARVVDENINAAKDAHTFFEHLPHLVFTSHIANFAFHFAKRGEFFQCAF